MKYVIMTADHKKFGYLSGPYGMVEAEVPAATSFPEERFVLSGQTRNRINNAKLRSIANAEAELQRAEKTLDANAHRANQFLYDNVERRKRELAEVKAKEWVIVEVTIKEVDRI